MEESNSKRRVVFLVSDRTGISVEILSRNLLSQFEGITFDHVTMPFVDTVDKANAARAEINRVVVMEAAPPLVFSTLVREDLREILAGCDAIVMDFFQAFVTPLEQELGMPASQTMGRTHGLIDAGDYRARIEAVDFTLSHDDGLGVPDYAAADVILAGVSRSGKTPTCLYLALQYHVRAANYPLTPDDLAQGMLPAPLEHHQAKVVGLTISPQRLQQIRDRRRPGSAYAGLRQCQTELRQADALFRGASLPVFDATEASIEELATNISHTLQIGRHRQS